LLSTLYPGGIGGFALSPGGETGGSVALWEVSRITLMKQSGILKNY